MNGPNGCADRGCDNGTLGMAWGSGTANFPYLVTPDSALQSQAIADGTIYQSIFGTLIRVAKLSPLSVRVFTDLTELIGLMIIFMTFSLR